MGAPGTSYWTGSVLVYNSSSNVLSAYLDEDSIVLYGSYLGMCSTHDNGSMIITFKLLF